MRLAVACVVMYVRTTGRKCVLSGLGVWSVLMKRLECGGVPLVFERPGCFQGSVEVQKGIKVPCGVRDTVVANSSIHGSAVVASTGLLANTIVLGVGSSFPFLFPFLKPRRTAQGTPSGLHSAPHLHHPVSVP